MVAQKWERKEKEKEKKMELYKKVSFGWVGLKSWKIGQFILLYLEFIFKGKKKKSGCKERLGVKEEREWKTWSKGRKEIQENNIKVELKNVKIINRLKVKLENILRIWLEIIIHLGFLC